jgi:hypothetical protein
VDLIGYLDIEEKVREKMLTARRLRAATSDVSGENRHHQEVYLVVLYAVLPFFS